jgi:acyl carrier protein
MRNCVTRLVAPTFLAVMLLVFASPARAADCGEAVRKLIAEHMGIGLDKVVPRARFKDDLKADDLDMIEIVMASEEDFNVVISESDEKGLLTVADLIAYLNTRAKQGCK